MKRSSSCSDISVAAAAMDPPPARERNDEARRELVDLFRLQPNEAGNALERIRQFLESHPGICEHRNRDTELPLHTAVRMGCPLPTLQLVTSFHPEALTSRKEDGRTPLHIACQNAAPFNLEVFQFLATPATLLYEDNHNGLPLHHYCQRGTRWGGDYPLDVDVIKFLMGGDRGILLQADDFCDTALHAAVSTIVAGDAPVIQWLVNERPHQTKDLLMLQDPDGYTPLHTACYFYEGIPSGDDDEIIQLLARVCPEAAGVVSEAGGETPLHLYCFADHSPNRVTLQSLLQADPRSAHLLNCNEKFPVELVFDEFRFGNLDTHELVSLVDAFGSDLLTIRDDDGKTVLHRAIDSSNDVYVYVHVELVAVLAPKFISLLEDNGEDGNLLHYICEKTGMDPYVKVGCLQVLTLASTERAISARNGQGETPLHVLCRSDEVTTEQLEVFATSELAVSARGPQGQTPLHVLCSNNNVAKEHLQVLLHECPTLAMMPDDNGQLPLHKMALKNEAVAGTPTFHAALLCLHAAFSNAIHVRDSPATRAGMTPLEVAQFEAEDASLTIVYLLFRFDPVTVLNSWQEANATDEE